MTPVRKTPETKEEYQSLEDRLKTDFITLSSHQLRTPLSAIKWFTEILLRQRKGKLNKKQLEYLQEIYRSNERAIALVNDLLHVSRVEEDKLHLNLSPVDIVGLFEESIDVNRALLNARKLSINLEVLHGPVPKVSLDKVKIRRVIGNLLDNAIRYTPPEGTLGVVIKNNAEEVVCAITDTGVGIPAEQQGQVFERFFRGTNVIKIQPEGTGLGLFIAKAFMEAHGGQLWFESAEGAGSTFYFSLPTRPGKRASS